MPGQGRCCRKLLEGHCDAEKEGRRNGAEESRFAVIGGLGCYTKDLGPSPASRWLGRRIRN